MDLARRVQLNASKSDASSHDITIVLGYAVLAIVMLLAIYFAAGSSGTAPADFTSMVAFP
jgi:hypothetical protein